MKNLNFIFKLITFSMLILFPIYANAAAVDDDYTITPPATEVNGSVLNNDSGSQYMRVESWSTPANGTLTNRGKDWLDNYDGTFTYTPNSEFSGDDTFTYKMQYFKQGSLHDGGTATVTIHVGVVTSADLKLTENASPAPNPVTIGNNVTFSVRVNNDGPDAALGNIVLTATYNQAVTIVSATQTQGGGDFSCASSGATITCTKTNQMNKAAPNKDFEFIVQPSSAGTLTQTATVESSTTSDPNTDNNTLTSSVEVVSQLSIDNASDKTIQATVGITPIAITASGGTTPYTYSLTGQPSGLTIDSATGKISGASTAAAGTGFFDVNATVTDASGATASTLFKVTVTPIANPDSYDAESDVQFDGNVVSNNDVVTSPNVTLLNNVSNGVLTINGDGSFSYISNVGFTGVDTFEYKVVGTYGEDTTTVNINVISTELIAVSDTYNVKGLTEVTGNLLSNDTPPVGPIASPTSIQTGANGGSLIISPNGDFTYTPATAGTEMFTYTITLTLADGTVKTASTTVTFNVDTEYKTGVQPFTLINSVASRNIIGSYQIAGNTVMCLTTKTSGYGTASNACQDANYRLYTSNMRVSKYLDIDDTDSTWNSTSSYIDLPSNYTGIAWAGLFWQGRISRASTYEMHYGQEDGAGYDLVETGKNANYPAVKLLDEKVNEIRLKINSGTYEKVTADTVYNIGNDTARTYAAFSNVTALLQNAAMSDGENTFTVANLVTNEGREASPGVFGGWSLVVIYLQDIKTGTPQNISIYSGFDSVGTNNKPIEIYGFKLPSGGNKVTANLSLFSGEGEFRYGYRDGNSKVDWMKISDKIDTDYQFMPGLSNDKEPGNRNNVFDATFQDIKRAHIDGEYNDLQINNDGVDVDNFDVSDIITDYRDSNPDIDKIYIKYYSNNDYITPSMIAFSTELYQPKICYDYTVDIGGYVLDSENNEIKTPFPFNTSLPVTTRVTIRSDEGDFDLNDVNMTYSITNTNELQYTTGTTAIAPNDIYNYIPASNLTYAEGNSGFGMYINDPSDSGACNDDPGCGGTIKSYERRYVKFVDKLQHSSIDTNFKLSLQYTVNYGSGPVPQYKELDATSLCTFTGGYTPAWGTFNVSSDEASTTTGTPYNLYTQITNRSFGAQIYHYEKNTTTGTYDIPADTNASIEVEIFNASFFPRDINVSCFNPDSNITVPEFVRFDWGNTGTEHNYAPVSLPALNFAIRNAGFRTWNLVKSDGVTLVYHQCDSRTNETCFRNVYNENYYGDDTHCTAECGSSGSGCYACLRKFYGKPICSRDNFSIRPEAFVTKLLDSNQSDDTTDPSIELAHSKEPSEPSTLTKNANLIAGYKYRFDINATNYIDDSATPKYFQSFTNDSLNARSYMDWSPPSSIDDSNCNDIEDRNITILLFNGNSINTYNEKTSIDFMDEVGNYQFAIEDKNWTAVDWNPDDIKHHARSGFDNIVDCQDNASVLKEGTKGKQGCLISSVHEHPNGTDKYYALDLRFYPYTFDASSLTFGGGPGNGNSFVYINSLNKSLYPNGIDENMSYNVQGTFRAKGWSDTPGGGIALENFVKNCYAEDIEMKLKTMYLSDKPATSPDFTYSLLDYNTTDRSITYPSGNAYNDRIENAFSNAAAKNTEFNLTVTQKKENFDKSMQGAISMDLGFNFPRTNNQLLNPRHIRFNDFNITYDNAPQFKIELRPNSNLYKIHGNQAIDQNISFFYARAKPSKTLYDDITTSNVDTPVSVVVYCDLGYTECQNRGILALLAKTNEPNWWKSVDHSQLNADGNIELSSVPTAALNSTTVNINSNGINETVNVNNGGTVPLTVPIDLVVDDLANPGPTPYTDRWLIYNPENATLPPIPFYRVRFIGNTGWVGYGDTGHVVGGTMNQKDSGRVEW